MRIFSNFNLLHILLAVLLLACTSAKQASPNSEAFFTVEQFGGQAWYLPADGRLQEGIQYPLINYTPASVDAGFLKGLGLKGANYTRISLNQNFFPEDIVGKSFCGLFAHQNPNVPDYNAVDAFYPQEISSRYAKVVHRIDAKNVIVDFEYNGGNASKPQKIANGKGYFFHDNSVAWDKLRQAFTARTNRIEEIKLRGFEIKNNVQALYVIPQYGTWNFTPTNCKIWSGTKNIAALKIGFEDYYQYEKALGKSVLNQPEFLFNLPGSEHNHTLLVHAKIYPPHRTILEASTYKRTFFVGRKAGGVTALVGATQFDEERFVKAGKGISRETFISWSFSAISGGGRLTDAKNGVLQDVQDFGYVLCKEYEQRAGWFTQMNAANGGGNYLVVEDADLYFEDQAAVNPPSQLFNVKLNQGKTAYTGFAEVIQNRSKYYLPYTLEIDGPGNFFKVFALGGSNRTSVISINGQQSVLTFLANAQGVRADNPGELVGYWEFAYCTDNDKYDWGWKNGQSAIPARTSGTMILYEQIPLKVKRYTISRDYIPSQKFEELIDANNAQIATVNEKVKNRKPKTGEVYSHAVRTAVAWTTVLKKYAVDIDASIDIPANGMPLAMQPGDRFKIPTYKGSTHNPNEIYTVMSKERGLFPALPAEFVGIKSRKDWKYSFSNFQSYRFFSCFLDKDLPDALGLTFEIEIVESRSEELLDGKARESWLTYKGIARMAHNRVPYTAQTPFDSPAFSSGEPLGHLCYSQVELTEWYKNVHWNKGLYRQNTNSGRGFETYTLKNDQGKAVQVNPLARYSTGKTFINCTGGPVGQYSDRLNDFQVRDWIHQSNGKPLPEKQKAKMRLYNSPNVRTHGVKQPEKYLEIYPNTQGAPEMPKACRDLLNSLPH